MLTVKGQGLKNNIFTDRHIGKKRCLSQSVK